MSTTAVQHPITTYHPAASRGHANHGWLDSHHSFSFANYRNAERMNFGVLRVLNDDVVAGGKGFGTHAHDNMEIVSIPLEGDLTHQDSMGNETVIKAGDVQIMSAGTGVRHSEMNASATEQVKFLQIWMFPDKRGVKPRYDQVTLSPKPNAWQQILSPNEEDAGVWAHQNAWWSIGEFEAGQAVDYVLHAPDSNGVYLFVLEGEAQVGEQALGLRDGYGLEGVEAFSLTAVAKTRVLLMEVPMAVG